MKVKRNQKKVSSSQECKIEEATVKKQRKKQRKKERKVRKINKEAIKNRYKQQEEQEESNKDNKQKRKKHDEVDFNELFDDEAESEGDQDQQFSQNQQEQEFDQNEYKKLYQRKNNGNYLDRFKDKSEKEINDFYNKKLRTNKRSGGNWPKLYAVSVKPKSEEDLVLAILNKAKHLSRTASPVKIVSVLALKRRHPGKIFIEAFSQSDIQQCLQGFNNVKSSKKFNCLSFDCYQNLFAEKIEDKIQIHQNSYVRIRGGLYEGDLAKIYKMKKSSVDVLLVPRINVHDILAKIKEEISKYTDAEEIEEKKKQIFRWFINHRSKNYKIKPMKSLLTAENVSEIQENFKGKFSVFNGLIVLNYRIDEIMKVQGTYLPNQVLPFASEGKFIQQIGERKTVAVNFKKGENVDVVGGELARHYGVVVEIANGIGIIKCKNKQLENQTIFQPIEHLSKRFKEHQNVQVISGIDSGKSGIILRVDTKSVDILTSNNNTIKVNKTNLQLYNGEIAATGNPHNLKMNDLIKTSKGVVGTVVGIEKNVIRIVDTNNSVVMVNLMDFDSVVNNCRLVAKNRNGDEISSASIVFIRSGVNEGKRCRVVHVYRQFVFLFNELFIRTAGILVENADNCLLVGKNCIQQRRAGTRGEGEICVGDTVTIKKGGLKNYQGIIKSIVKDKIQVRVPSKSMTVFVDRESLGLGLQVKGSDHLLNS